MIRFKLKVPPGWVQNAPYGWSATYDKDGRRWLIDSSSRPTPNTRANLVVDQLPENAPADLAGYADKLSQPDFQDPGTQYVDFSDKSALPDGFVIKGLVKDLTGKQPRPEPGLVAVRTINGARIRCRSLHLSDDGIRNEAVELFKGATIQTWPLLSLPFPSGWVLAPDGVTLIVALGEQAQLVYFDTVAGKEVKRVDLDFQPGNLAVQSQTLFAATRGASAVHALDLDTRKAGKEFSLGSDAVANLACHPSRGLLYASTTGFQVYSIDSAGGAVTKTAAKGFFLAIDPEEGKFLYTGIQPPDRDEIEFREGPDGSFRIVRDMWGKRAMIMKYAVEGPQLRYVDGQNNAAVNGWSMALTPDGKRIMIDGGGGLAAGRGGRHRRRLRRGRLQHRQPQDHGRPGAARPEPGLSPGPEPGRGQPPGQRREPVQRQVAGEAEGHPDHRPARGPGQRVRRRRPGDAARPLERRRPHARAGPALHPPGPQPRGPGRPGEGGPVNII
jgi:hypothetical protein